MQHVRESNKPDGYANARAKQRRPDAKSADPLCGATDGALDARAAVQQLQFLICAVRQGLVRQAEVDRDARFGPRAHERVQNDEVVELRFRQARVRGRVNGRARNASESE